MRFLLLVLAACFSFFGTECQNTIGLPEITNYAKKKYGAGTQNWDIKKDKNGILYFANNDGLLTFDGTYWKIHPLPNKSIVRSVEITQDNRIYIGGQEELGYFYPDINGNLVYTSLKHLIPKDQSSFADVWDVIAYENQVFFRSNRKIFQYAYERITVFNSIDWRFMGWSNGRLVAQDYQRDLLTFRDGIWMPFIKSSAMTGDFFIRASVDIGVDSTLVATKNGIFLLHKDRMLPFETPDLKMINEKKVYAAARLDTDRFALATNLGGCFIINGKGELVQRLAKEDGIQNNNILSVFVDQQKNLWLGLDNGIDFVSYGSALKKIAPNPLNKYSGYASIIYHNELYLGTSAGAFKASLSNLKDISLVRADFIEVKNTRGQVWSFADINGKLLMGHNDGAFTIQNNVAIPFDPTSGFWTFQPLFNVSESTKIIAGTYNGINFYDYKDGNFIDNKVHAHFESARFVVNDSGSLWIAHPYKGLYRVNFSADNIPTSSNYIDKKGILSTNNNYLFKVKNKTILCTEKGIYEFDHDQNDFVESVLFKNIFKGRNISYLKEDSYGNIWFIADKQLGIIEQHKQKTEVRYFTEFDNKILTSGNELINPVDSNNIFIAAEDGFYHLNFATYKKHDHPLTVLIRSVRSVNKTDSLVFGGYQSVENMSADSRQISAAWNSFRFEYSATVYDIDNVEYSYFLNGFDNEWSDWNRKTEKEYTNLPPGSYTFSVKARYNAIESSVTSYAFTILPAWYQTIWAKVIYGFIFLILAYLVYKAYRKKLLKQQLEHEEEQNKLQYLHQLELEKTDKEIVKLRNEKLEAEIQHKNTELASNAMHLLQKGELLTKIKDELLKLKKNNNSDDLKEEFKKIVRILGEEEKMDGDWEQFAQHFDKVHTDFLLELKKHHPGLSPNELKLCAYLRMNLSTKEIAQLMNITVRGVEISRYRLRKKLQMNKSDNLFDFLLKLDGNGNGKPPRSLREL